MNKLQEANLVIDKVREQTDTIAIGLSLGKDSLVTLDLCYPKFRRIVCFFMYFVKGLDHIQRWINWTKARYPNIEFVEIPHWTLSYVLRSGLYCAPDPNVKLIKLDNVIKTIRLTYNVEYVFLGMKKADSMNRRLMLNTYKERDYINKGLVYPLASWTQKEILLYMKNRGIPEPVRYSLKASSGVGFSKDCFLWLRENYPQDLLKIYDVFPFARTILFEYDEAEKRKLAQQRMVQSEKEENDCEEE